MDKFELIYKMTAQGGYYFLSRPRRFGKSLLVSTMEAYFIGKKDLFEGLSISFLENKWNQYPVLRFDLTGQAYTSPEALVDTLNRQQCAQEKLYGVTEKAGSEASRFRNLIDAALQKLVDLL